MKTFVSDGVVTTAEEQERLYAEDIKAFTAMTDGDALKWTYLPVGLRDKSDPLGQRGYIGWKYVLNGEQYGAVEELTRDDDWRDVVRKCRADALASVAHHFGVENNEAYKAASGIQANLDYLDKLADRIENEAPDAPGWESWAKAWRENRKWFMALGKTPFQ